MQTTPIPMQKEEKQNPFEEGKTLLFRPGVQMRLIVAVILLLFTAIVSWALLSMFFDGYILWISFEILVTAPMVYGLFVMTRDAANGMPVSIRGLFAAFSRYYWHSLMSMLFFCIFYLSPLILPFGTAIGTFMLADYLDVTSAYSAYAFLIRFFGILLALGLVLPSILLQKYAYLFMAVRVKDRTVSVFRAIAISAQALKCQMGLYLKIRMRFLLLDLLSLASVCALFVLYTVPLYCTVTAKLLDISERKTEQTDEGANTVTVPAVSDDDSQPITLL